MAIVKSILHKKNSSGTYDDIYLRTRVDNVLLSDNSTLLSTKLTSVDTEISSLKSSVSNGKSLIASAITGKGVSTASDATFQTMANNIGSIATGAKLPSTMTSSYTQFLGLSGLNNITKKAGYGFIIEQYTDYDSSESTYSTTSINANSTGKITYDYYNNGKNEMGYSYYVDGVAVPCICTSSSSVPSRYCTASEFEWFFVLSSKCSTSSSYTQAPFEVLINGSDLNKEISIATNVSIKLTEISGTKDSYKHIVVNIINNTSKQIRYNHNKCSAYWFYKGTLT